MARWVNGGWFLALTVLLAGCNGGSSGSGTSNSGPIKIGVVLELSGQTATYGEESQNGMNLALEEVNKGREKKIELIYLDNKGEPTESANSVVQLIEVNKVLAIIGAVASSNTLAGATRAQESHTPMMTPGSTNDTITTDTGEYISRVCFTDSFQGRVMAEVAYKDLKKIKAYLIVDKASAYSLGLAGSFRRTFESLGGNVVDETSYEAGASDFSALVTQVKAAQPDVIFIPGYYEDVVKMLNQAQGHWDGIAKLGGDGWDSETLIKDGGANVVGTIISSHFAPDDPDPKIQAFTSAYEERYGKPPGSMSALGYDAILVMADAIDRTGVDLTQENLKVARDKLKDAINATKGVEGVTGSITLDENRNPLKNAVILDVAADGFKLRSKVSP